MTEIPDPFHVDVARIALAAVNEHGFALGGGHALVAHGLVFRPTEDIDLFTDKDGGVRAGTVLVREALAETGLTVEHEADNSDLAELFYGMDDAFEELDVSDGDAIVRLSLGRLPRQREPVLLDVGPVLHIDDLLAPKVCAMATRGEVRDYVDVAAALGHGYERTRLVAMARDHDPRLTDEEFAQAMARLDATPDEPFAFYGLDADAVAAMRARFDTWPRA